MYSAYKLNKQGDNIYGHCLKVTDAPIMRLLFGGLVSGKVLHMHWDLARVQVFKATITSISSKAIIWNCSKLLTLKSKSLEVT